MLPLSWIRGNPSYLAAFELGYQFFSCLWTQTQISAHPGSWVVGFLTENILSALLVVKPLNLDYNHTAGSARSSAYWLQILGFIRSQFFTIKSLCVICSINYAVKSSIHSSFLKLYVYLWGQSFSFSNKYRLYFWEVTGMLFS